MFRYPVVIFDMCEILRSYITNIKFQNSYQKEQIHNSLIYSRLMSKKRTILWAHKIILKCRKNRNNVIELHTLYPRQTKVITIYLFSKNMYNCKYLSKRKTM